MNQEDPIGILTQNHEVDLEIELQALEAIAAIATVNSIIEENRNKKDMKIWFRFELSKGNGQTLFQPIGKTLKTALSKGKITRAMPAQMGGWIIRI